MHRMQALAERNEQICLPLFSHMHQAVRLLRLKSLNISQVLRSGGHVWFEAPLEQGFS